AAAHPGGRMTRLLGSSALRWIGTRSYAIYLWHWPVFMLTRPRLDIALSGSPLLFVRLLIVAALSELSWRVVEQPFRSGHAQRAWRTLTIKTRRRVALTGATALAAIVPGLVVVHAPSTTPLIAGSTATRELPIYAPP